MRDKRATRRGSSTIRAGRTWRSSGGGWRSMKSTRYGNRRVLVSSSCELRADAARCTSRALGSGCTDGPLCLARHSRRDRTHLYVEFRGAADCDTQLTHVVPLDDYGWQDFSALAPKPVDTAAAADGSTPLTTAAALTPAEAVVLGNGTAIDPARQRCYCGAAECSGFLGGGRKKVGRGGGGGGGAANGAAKGDGGSTGANKGKRKGGAPPVQEEADSVSTLTRTDATEPQRPKLAFAQARIRVVDPNKPAPISAAAVESAPRPAKKPRSSSGATSRLATDEDLQDERNRVMGAMRSGREAAKKAAGKLVGSASGGRLSLGGGRR